MMQKSTAAGESGFSLLGVVVALGLLTAGIIAVAGLVARTDQATRLSRDRLVAINLAREGIELVQAQRDSNWGRQRADSTIFWADQLCDPAKTTEDQRFTVEYDPGGAGIVFNPTGGGGTAGQLYRVASGWYTHVAAAGDATSFSRVITIECGASNVPDPIPPVTAERFIEITSQVQWSSRGVDREAVLKTRLYDWGSPV